MTGSHPWGRRTYFAIRCRVSYRPVPTNSVASREQVFRVPKRVFGRFGENIFPSFGDGIVEIKPGVTKFSAFPWRAWWPVELALPRLEGITRTAFSAASIVGSISRGRGDSRSISSYLSSFLSDYVEWRSYRFSGSPNIVWERSVFSDGIRRRRFRKRAFWFFLLVRRESPHGFSRSTPSLASRLAERLPCLGRSNCLRIGTRRPFCRLRRP